MEFTPRYDGPAVIDIDAVVANPAPAFVRQRDRLVNALSAFSPDEWAAPSRCAGWSVQDVGEHLAGVNRFWLHSLRSGLGGEPSRLLLNFDPVTVPAQMVESVRGEAPAATLERLGASNAELIDLLGSMSERDWHKPAEAPPGHIAITAVCAHALWDAWIHERDVLLPLGQQQELESDELSTSLAYVAALAPAFYVNADQSRSGSLAVQTHRPDMVFTVDVSDRVVVRRELVDDATAAVEIDAVELLEALSCRAPLPHVAPDHRWLIDGLQMAFGSGG